MRKISVRINRRLLEFFREYCTGAALNQIETVHKAIGALERVVRLLPDPETGEGAKREVEQFKIKLRRYATAAKNFGGRSVLSTKISDQTLESIEYIGKMINGRRSIVIEVALAQALSTLGYSTLVRDDSSLHEFIYENCPQERLKFLYYKIPTPKNPPKDSTLVWKKSKGHPVLLDCTFLMALLVGDQTAVHAMKALLSESTARIATATFSEFALQVFSQLLLEFHQAQKEKYSENEVLFQDIRSDLARRLAALLRSGVELLETTSSDMLAALRAGMLLEKPSPAILSAFTFFRERNENEVFILSAVYHDLEIILQWDSYHRNQEVIRNALALPASSQPQVVAATALLVLQSPPPPKYNG